MTAAIVAGVIAAVVFAGGLAGLMLHRVLPPDHRTKETRDVVLLGTGMLSVIAALVLGLLIATAHDTLATADTAVRGFAADLIQVDQTLRLYGPHAEPIRDLLRRYTAAAVRDDWTQGGRDFLDRRQRAGTTLQRARQLILSLEPQGPAQPGLRDRALASMDALLKARWQLLEDQDLPIRPAFLIILTFWITVIFLSFGFGAPGNATVAASFLICAASVGASIFLILEMETPFTGLIQTSSGALEIALAQMVE